MPTTTIQDWGDAVFLAISNSINTFLSALPQVIGALLILVIGWIIASLVGRLTAAVLRRTGTDRLMATHGTEVYGDRATRYQPSIVVAEIVKWIIRFVFLVAAANVLGLTQVSTLLNEVLLWIPNLLVAAVILLVAPIIARWVRGAIEVGAGQMGFTNAPFLGRLAEIAIVVFAVVIAVNQIGIAADLVNILFVGVVAALALALGLAFGLGGRDVAARMTEDWYSSMRSAADRVQRSAGAGSEAVRNERRPSRSPSSASSATARPR